jgi:hypothetical protein
VIKVNTATDDLASYPAHTRQLIYCALDSMMTREIWDKVSLLADKNKAWGTYAKTQSYLPVALDMMDRGWNIDDPERQRVLHECKREARRLELYLNYFAKAVWGKPINPRSSVQLQAFFFDALLIPVKFATKKGEFRVSTDRNTLEALARDYTRATLFARIIMKLRLASNGVCWISAPRASGARSCANPPRPAARRPPPACLLPAARACRRQPHRGQPHARRDEQAPRRRRRLRERPDAEGLPFPDERQQRRGRRGRLRRALPG